MKDKDSDKISDLTPNDAPKSDTKAPSNESPPVTDTNAKSEPEKPVASDDKILQFVVIYSKEKYDVKMSENSTVLQLKTHLESIIGK